MDFNSIFGKLTKTSSAINTNFNLLSLKVKLMLRRPINQLVAQGIMPPLKTPPAFHEQRRQLERAKTGDMLKAKIQQRPARIELERRHILEYSSPQIDPSLAERQRMLKKARLADQLNDQLSHRPGPLELIKKNILHTEEPIEEAVKAGRIPFKATSEGLSKPLHPSSYIVNHEDDSQSSAEGGGSGSDVIESAAKSAGIVVSLAVPISTTNQHVVQPTPVSTTSLTFAELCNSVTGAANFLPLAPTVPIPPTAPSPAPSSSLSPLSSLASPATPQTPLTPRAQPSPAPGKDKNRKKAKLKSQPKARTIKFHEYKGPPSAQKNNAANNSNTGETSYQLLLEQQQLFLQWQLEWQHKYPQIILPATQKTQTLEELTPAGSPPSSTTNSIPEPPQAPRALGRLEDMKVSDLKAELKRRNLPVSGPKPQLIERLKPYTEMALNHSVVETQVLSEESQNDEDNKSQASPAGSDQGSMDVVPESPAPQSNEDIVREQQRRIEELQRELTRSQLQLQQVRNGVTSTTGQKLALQHHVQARQALRQQQHIAFQNAAKNAANLGGGLVLNGQQAALVLNQLQLHKAKLVNGQTGTISNFLSAIPIVPAAVITTAPPELVQVSRPQPEQIVQSPAQNGSLSESSQFDDASPHQSPSVSSTNGSSDIDKNIKSQIVDDVLEILIKNGELPPSAANDPLTPNCDMQTDSPLTHHQEISQAISDQMSQELSEAMSQHEMAAQRKEQERKNSTPHSPMCTLDALFLNQTPNDLKDLALELETLDTVDFSALDMELDRHQEAMEEAKTKVEVKLETNTNTTTPAPPVQQDEMMDVCSDMHMEMDEPDWLDSLMPTESSVPSQPTIESQAPNLTIPLQQTIPTTVSYNDYSNTINAYDPLLGNTLLGDPFDLFGLEEFRGVVNDLTSAPPTTMSWDKLDFAA